MRKIFRIGLVVLLGSMFQPALVAEAGLAGETSLPDRPNVLFIAVDDLRPELGVYGNTSIKTPNIDRLARRGLLFRRAYAQRAICMPSRVSVMSGYRPETFAFSPRFTDERMPEGTVSLAQLFKREGYRSVSIGKIYHSNQDDPEGWSERYEDTFGEHSGFASGYQTRENKDLLPNYFKRSNEFNDGLARPDSVEHVAAPDDAYPDAVVADRAIDELNRAAGSGEPFFLAAGFYRPHLPFAVPKKYWDVYATKDIELPPNREPVVNGVTRHEWDELRRYGDIPDAGPLSDDKAREMIHGYYASVSFVDHQIGRVLDELARLELDDKTIVILWGDHGWNLGEHGWWSKHTNYETSTRTAMMIIVPGMRQGIQTDALVELVDIYPTLCELAGIEAPAHLEGSSFVPLLKDPGREWKTAAFSHIKGAASIRTDRYRLIRHANGKLELFDHLTDPGENRNLAGDDVYADAVEALTVQLDNGWQNALPK